MSDAQSKIVLVVDDEPDVCRAVSEMFRRSGYQVMESRSAKN